MRSSDVCHLSANQLRRNGVKLSLIPAQQPGRRRAGLIFVRYRLLRFQLIQFPPLLNGIARALLQPKNIKNVHTQPRLYVYCTSSLPGFARIPYYNVICTHSFPYAPTALLPSQKICPHLSNNTLRRIAIQSLWSSSQHVPCHFRY